jgi:hypothetical protein
MRGIGTQLCKICETRRPRRFCPGVHGDICAICCGESREQTVHCPLTCEYLQEARKHEEPPAFDSATFPNSDIRVTEEFLRAHEPLCLMISVSLLQAALETPDAVDYDVREALEALVKTYRTLQSGLVYETRPTNPIAAAIAEKVQTTAVDFQERAQKAAGVERVRDTEILGVLAFLQRMELQQNNGRRLGRSFVDFLRVNFPRTAPEEAAPSLLI